MLRTLKNRVGTSYLGLGDILLVYWQVVSQQTLRKQKELSENALRSQVSIQYLGDGYHCDKRILH